MKKLFLCGGMLLAALAGTSTWANTIIVNTLADPGSTGVCALRDAITAANTNVAVNGCPAGDSAGIDTIQFNVSGTITLSNTLPNISDPAGLTIDGSGQSVTVSGNHSVQVMQVAAGAVLNLKYLTVANGRSDNSGGGVVISNSSTATVTNSTFSGNSAACHGGAIESDGSLTIVNSTFSGNSIGPGSNGCDETGYGGALETFDNSHLTIINSTFSGNSATLGGADISTIFATVNLQNTILASRTSVGDCRILGGSLAPSGMNLVGDTSCGSDPTHFITGVDPKLGPLADNGGPTQTMALQQGSPAIDKADNNICAADPVNNIDQRGQSRPVDGDGDGVATCDIGAYEFGILFPFNGFFAPVDNPPIENTVKAGSGIPVKFSLGGDRGLNIFAAGYPASLQIACSSGAPSDAIEATTSAGASSLSYDPATDTYTYVWKTDKSWANTCRQLSLKLTDGSVHTALFKFSH